MAESARPRVVGFNHVALEVGDIEEALAFYGRLFTFNLRGKSDSMAFIDLGDQFIALQKGRRQPADDGRHFGLVVDDKEAARKALKEAGVTPLDGPFPAGARRCRTRNEKSRLTGEFYAAPLSRKDRKELKLLRWLYPEPKRDLETGSKLDNLSARNVSSPEQSRCSSQRYRQGRAFASTSSSDLSGNVTFVLNVTFLAHATIYIELPKGGSAMRKLVPTRHFFERVKSQMTFRAQLSELSD
jgi:catechol 2,3-dioxygenase-like lactoylglutathione lyase family enzyme